MSTLWLIVAGYVLGALIAAFFGGLHGDSGEDVAEFAIIWPVVVVCFVIILPFYFAMRLGRKLHE